jgi:hypothetical protein
MSGLILRWEDVQPESGRQAEAVQAVCRRCRAAQGARRDERGWTRTNPCPERTRPRSGSPPHHLQHAVQVRHRQLDVVVLALPGA